MNNTELIEQLKIVNSVFQYPVESYEKNYPALYEKLQDVVTKHPLLKTPLLPHQERMVKAMHIYRHTMQEGIDLPGTHHHLKGKIGVVADRPGSGKTLSLLGFLASGNALPSPHTMGEHLLSSNMFFFSHTVTVRDASSVSLVVVPPHLLQQWRTETATHTHMVPFVIDSRRLLRNRTTPEAIRNSPFILTTSKLYKDTYEYLTAQRISIKYICFDEATHLYVGPNDPVPVAEFIWLISSRWICFLFKNTYLNLATLASVRGEVELNEGASQWIEDVQRNDIVMSTALEGSSFFKHLLPFQHPCRGAMILRNSASPSLPCMQEQVIECSTKLTLASIPPTLLGKQYEGLTHERIPKLFRALDIPTLTFEQLLGHHPERSALIHNKVDDNCSICIDSPQNKVFLSCCMNVFCGACMLRQLLTHPQCPTCRALLFLPNMLYIRDLALETEPPLETRSEACISYILNHSNESHIIYTVFENTFYQLQHILERNGIVCEQLDTNPGKFNRTISNFNRGTTKVLVVSCSKQIQGITLSKASHFIFFYESSFYGQGQSMIQSAQRLGRSGSLTLVHLKGGLD
jgi:hypothetical protein